MFKTKILINFIISFLFLNCEEIIYDNETFLEWGLRNNLKLSSYIEAKAYGKNKIKFIAKTDIPAKTDLLTIPYNIMFNLNKVMELINSKTLNKQYNDFLKINLTLSEKHKFRKEESFLSYIFYLINHRPKKYQKTKFYEIYKNYFELIKKYYSKSPIFYQPDEMEYYAFFTGTYLNRALVTFKSIYQDEIDIYTKKDFYNRIIDYDEYAHYRLTIYKYGLNISNHMTLIPFLNFIKDDYSKYNSNYTIEENGDIKIYSVDKIKKGDEIILLSKKMANVVRFIREGKTYEELVDYFEQYNLKAFSPIIYYKYNTKMCKLLC